MIKIVNGEVCAMSDEECAQRLAEEEAWAGTASVRAAAKERFRADETERLQAKLDAAVMALVDATPAQLLTYARNNFPSLTPAEQNRLGAILHILAVAVRPQVR